MTHVDVVLICVGGVAAAVICSALYGLATDHQTARRKAP